MQNNVEITETLPFLYIFHFLGNQHFEFPPRPLLQVASQSSSYTDPGDCFNFDKIQYEYTNPSAV